VDAVEVVSGGKIPAGPQRRAGLPATIAWTGCECVYIVYRRNFFALRAELAALLGQITTLEAPALLALATGENRSSIDGNSNALYCLIVETFLLCAAGVQLCPAKLLRPRRAMRRRWHLQLGKQLF